MARYVTSAATAVNGHPIAMRATPSHVVSSASYRWFCTTNRDPNTATQVSVAMSNARTAFRTSRQPASSVCTQPQMYPTTGRRISTEIPNTTA